MQEHGGHHVNRRIFPIAALAASMSLSVASAQEVPVRAEIVARLPQSFGNIAITPDNQIIFSHHPFFSPDVRVAIERYSDKPNNGGLSIDYAGNLYLTAVETKSIGVVGADRKYRTYLSDPEMVWPDGITASPDGYMYVSASQISAAAMFHGGKAENKTPYLIYRFKPLAAGYVSR